MNNTALYKYRTRLPHGLTRPIFSAPLSFGGSTLRSRAPPRIADISALRSSDTSGRGGPAASEPPPARGAEVAGGPDGGGGAAGPPRFVGADMSGGGGAAGPALRGGGALMSGGGGGAGAPRRAAEASALGGGGATGGPACRAAASGGGASLTDGGGGAATGGRGGGADGCTDMLLEVINTQATYRKGAQGRVQSACGPGAGLRPKQAVAMAQLHTLWSVQLSYTSACSYSAAGRCPSPWTAAVHCALQSARAAAPQHQPRPQPAASLERAPHPLRAAHAGVPGRWARWRAARVRCRSAPDSWWVRPQRAWAGSTATHPAARLLLLA